MLVSVEFDLFDLRIISIPVHTIIYNDRISKDIVPHTSVVLDTVHQ